MWTLGGTLSRPHSEPCWDTSVCKNNSQGIRNPEYKAYFFAPLRALSCACIRSQMFESEVRKVNVQKARTNGPTCDLESQGKLLEPENIDRSTWCPHISQRQALPDPEIPAAEQESGFFESLPRADKVIPPKAVEEKYQRLSYCEGMNKQNTR